LRTAWEAIDHRWNQWVLQYSNEEQMNLLRAWGWASPDGQALGQILASALAALAVGSSVLLKLRGSGAQTTTWTRATKRMDQALRPLAPTLSHDTPWPASVWRERLLRQWAAGSTVHGDHTTASLTTSQQALLESLLDLDAARYGPGRSDAARRLPRRVSALLRRVEQLSRACQIPATTATL
jgi:protein-glutamine gamma-glutamyltransferase